MSGEGPTEVFRAYLSALAIDGQSARVAERWSGIEGWREAEATRAQVPALVAKLWGDDEEANDELFQPLVERLNAADDTFNTVEAPEAMRLLAAAALDSTFTYSDGLDLVAALAVANAGWANREPANLAVKIVERAQAELDHIADHRRARTDLLAGINEMVAPVFPNTSAGLKQIKDGGLNDAATIASAFEQIIASVNKSLAQHVGTLKSQMGRIAKRVALCDEESDVLWYVFSGVSTDGDAPYALISPMKSAFYASREIAAITTVPLRTDAALEFFRRCSADGEPVSFADAVELMSPEWIREHVPQNPSPRLFPVHKALDRFRDIGEPKTWVSSWSKATGIDQELKVTPDELALQLYRERLLLKSLA